MLFPKLCYNKLCYKEVNVYLRDMGTQGTYRKVPKFSDTRKLCCNLSKSQTKSPNLRVFCQKDENGIANSEDPEQTAPLGAV